MGRGGTARGCAAENMVAAVAHDLKVFFTGVGGNAAVTGVHVGRLVFVTAQGTDGVRRPAAELSNGLAGLRPNSQPPLKRIGCS